MEVFVSRIHHVVSRYSFSSGFGSGFGGGFSSGFGSDPSHSIKNMQNKYGYCTLIEEPVSRYNKHFVRFQSKFYIHQLFNFNTFNIFLNSLCNQSSCWLWQILNISKWCEIGHQCYLQIICSMFLIPAYVTLLYYCKCSSVYLIKLAIVFTSSSWILNLIKLKPGLPYKAIVDVA